LSSANGPIECNFDLTQLFIRLEVSRLEAEGWGQVAEPQVQGVPRQSLGTSSPPAPGLLISSLRPANLQPKLSTGTGIKQH